VNPGKYVSADFPTEEYVRSDSFSFSSFTHTVFIFYNPEVPHYRSAPLRASASLRLRLAPAGQRPRFNRGNNTRTRRRGGSPSPLRFASAFRSTSSHCPRYCFFALRSKKRERKLRIGCGMGVTGHSTFV
jgi:hypothetical protein